MNFLVGIHTHYIVTIRTGEKTLMQPPRCPYLGNNSAFRASRGVHNKFLCKMFWCNYFKSTDFFNWFYTHRTLPQLVSAPQPSEILNYSTKNDQNQTKSKERQQFFWCFQMTKLFKSCHIITLAIIFKRGFGGCMNSERINIEVCTIHD